MTAELIEQAKLGDSVAFVEIWEELKGIFLFRTWYDPTGMDTREDFEMLAQEGLWEGICSCEFTREGAKTYLVKSMLNRVRNEVHRLVKGIPPEGFFYLDTPQFDGEGKEVFFELSSSVNALDFESFFEEVLAGALQQGYPFRRIGNIRRFLFFRSKESCFLTEMAEKVFEMSPSNFLLSVIVPARKLLEEAIYGER